MEAMPELAEIKSEIGGVDFGAHGTSVSVGSNSTTPQPHQANFQWVRSAFRRTFCSTVQPFTKVLINFELLTGLR